MNNTYLAIYEEIKKSGGQLDQNKLDLVNKDGAISAYNVELLLRAYKNSKKIIVLKDLSDFSKKEVYRSTKKEVYFNSKRIKDIDLSNITNQEKEDIIAAILEALENPQNKFALCREDNIYISRKKRDFGFIYSLLRLPVYEYKVLFEVHDESLKEQYWMGLLYGIFKESFRSFEKKYLN